MIRSTPRGAPALQDTLLRELAALACQAGREISRLYCDGCPADTKTDGSPVTLADRLAEEIIREGLARLAPGVPIVGEEGVAGGDTPVQSDVFFLVDPLDGTNEFVGRETGEFAVNIALVEHGRATLGVVHAPVSGAVFIGGPEGAARAAGPDAPFAPIAVAEPFPQALRVVVSRRSARGPEFERLLAGLPSHRVMTMSSSLKLCVIAAGEADLYPRFGPVSEWDLAAGHAVLSAAGGGVMHLDGAAVRYLGRPDRYEVARFAAFGGPSAREALAQALTT